MSSKRYPEEFRIEAVKQVTERGHPVAEVFIRISASWPMVGILASHLPKPSRNC